MKNLITVNEQSLAIKEYKGQRVVTFKDIDTVHGRPDGTARRNFNVNKKHFIQDVDYFVRNSHEAHKEYNMTAPNGLILVTESGYLMLAKSFTDDLAWTVQRELVNTYFKCKEEPYQFIEKTYRGEPVITMRDFEHFTGVNYATAEWKIRNKNILRKNVDYYFLEGNELRNFKLENPQISKLTRYLILLNKNGFIKLCRALCIKISLPDCLALPPKVNFYEQKKVFDIKNNLQVQKIMGDINNRINALIIVLQFLNVTSSLEDYEKHVYELGLMSTALAMSVHTLDDAKNHLV